MRCFVGASLCIGVVTVLALAQPPGAKDVAPSPLLKAVTAPAGQVRVRVPLAEGEMNAIRMNARIPNPKKRGESIECTAALDTMNKNVVTSRMLEKWGFPKPQNGMIVLPELWLVGNQLGGKTGKDSDVLVRVINLRFDVIEASPEGSDQLFGADLLVNMWDMLRSAGRPHEARFHFPERFLDVTVPAIAVKRPGNGEELEPPAEVQVDPKRVSVACPLALQPGLSFVSASINGQSSFINPNGKMQGITPYLASGTHGGNGVIMNIGMARALKLDVDLTKEPVKGMSTDRRLRLIEYTLKELRVAALGGPALKTPQELVFTDVPVWIEVTESEPGLWIGFPFLAKHFHDGVLALSADGKATMHGRVLPELVQERRAKK